MRRGSTSKAWIDVSRGSERGSAGCGKNGLAENDLESEPRGLQSLGENPKKTCRRSLHYAAPNFLWMLVALANIMRLSLRKGAPAVLSSAAWQEIRVRSGRDDNSVVAKTSFSPGNAEFYPSTELSSRPERTRISCHAAPAKAAYAPFFKERRMMFANATNFYRKSGVA